MKLNFQETIRLVLQNAFKHDDADLTKEILELYQDCPTLFNKVLSCADQTELNTSPTDEDYEIDSGQSANASHGSPSAINRIPATKVTSCHAANAGQRLPLRSGQLKTTMTPIFRQLLRLAYEKDYGKTYQYPSTFENRIIQWSRKFGFTDR